LRMSGVPILAADFQRDSVRHACPRLHNLTLPSRSVPAIGPSLSVISIAPAITASVAKLSERRVLVEGDMIGLDALDLILRNVGARVMGIALVVDIAHMHANDRATDPSGLGIPTHAITDLEGFGHDGELPQRLEFS
jgi:hypothetical protein